MSRRRRTFVFVLVGGLVWCSGCGQGCGSQADSGAGGSERPATIVYLVRHAEKGTGNDPDLSERGKLRALALPSELEMQDIAAVYSTAAARTRQTAAPVAAIAGVPVTRMPPDDYDGLVQRVHSHAGKAVLVVGHSNTVGPILSALGVADQVWLGEDDYGDLFIATVPREGAATLELRRFGDHHPSRPPL